MRMTGASNAASEEQQQLQHALMDGAYSMGSGFRQAGSYFPCRECTAVFRSKQVGVYLRGMFRFFILGMEAL